MQHGQYLATTWVTKSTRPLTGPFNTSSFWWWTKVTHSQLSQTHAEDIILSNSCSGVDTFWHIGCGTILQSDHSILCQWETLRSGAIFGITPLTQQARILPFCSGRSNLGLIINRSKTICIIIYQFVSVHFYDRKMDALSSTNIQQFTYSSMYLKIRPIHMISNPCWRGHWTSLALERPGVASGGGAECGVGCAEVEVGGLRCSVPVIMSHK